MGGIEPEGVKKTGVIAQVIYRPLHNAAIRRIEHGVLPGMHRDAHVTLPNLPCDARQIRLKETVPGERGGDAGAKGHDI
ncbi:hypothetical protein SDC9_192102 [bioreactor metagenome]|uniref:Uncharacterized protein n=1 Tax=bioreactor metagenome TaxID=1076179 RepID=A0A645HZU3_9ZZZZ